MSIRGFGIIIGLCLLVSLMWPRSWSMVPMGLLCFAIGSGVRLYETRRQDGPTSQPSAPAEDR